MHKKRALSIFLALCAFAIFLFIVQPGDKLDNGIKNQKEQLHDYKEFAESMRNIMRNDEKNRKENNQRRDDNLDEDSRSLQEILEQKFDELFGPIDDEEE